MNHSDFNAFYDLAQRSTMALESIADSLGKMDIRDEHSTSGTQINTLTTEKTWKEDS